MAIWKKKSETITIPEPKFGYIDVSIIGDSRLVTHKWSEKAKREIRDKHEKKAKGPREIRNPQAEYEGSMYTLPNQKGYFFPQRVFKHFKKRVQIENKTTNWNHQHEKNE